MKIYRNPNLFHGEKEDKNFFEGWYFKLVNFDGSRTLALIPGISIGESDKTSESFIQIIDGEKKNFSYLKYPAESFIPNSKPFKLNLANSSFSLKSIELDIHLENFHISGLVFFHNILKWKDSIINPGSMGFYNYFPFMECYSQVCALDGDTKGFIKINSENINFNQGKIYIEKNWGKSFPSEWLWVQCNSFNDKAAALTCSFAKIPFPIRDFSGFLIGLTLNGKLYKFTTINKSTFSLEYINKDVKVISTNNNLQLTFQTQSNEEDFILCHGPKNGLMLPYVKEALTGKIYIKLEDTKKGIVLYENWSTNVGIEFGGNLMSSI